jgi:hypothetical protein
MSYFFRSLFLAAIFLFLLENSSSGAEKQASPTFVKEVMVQLPRAGEAQISLEAVPAYGNPISFEIQSPPAHGLLVGLTNTSDHTAMVTYLHDGSKTPLLDEFSFRAQAPGRAKSSLGKVSITIIPPAAMVVFEPKEFIFASLHLDEKNQLPVQIHNIGGSKAAGRILLPSGFSAPEGDSFSLEEGETSRMIVEFHPLEEKDYSAQAVTLPSCAKEELILTGKGIARFEVTQPDSLSCRVKNISEQTLNISFTGNTAWIMPSETLLSPHREKTFFFQQAETDGSTNAASLASKVHFSDGLSLRSLELPPPQGFIPLTLRRDGSPTLGNIPIGSSLPVVISLLNRSEMLKTVHWQALSSSGGGMNTSRVLELKGGEAQEIRYLWRPTIPGEATLNVTLDEGRKTHHEFLWQAMVTTSSHATSATLSESVDSEQKPSNGIAGEAPPQITSEAIKAIPPLEGISAERKVTWYGRSYLLLKYNFTQESTSHVTLEEKKFFPPEGFGVNSPKKANETANIPHIQVENVTVEFQLTKKSSAQNVIKISTLAPGWHLLVISMISKEGMIEAQSQLQIAMPGKPSWWKLLRVPLGLLGIFLLGAFLWKQRVE